MKRALYLSVYGWTYWLPILLAGGLVTLALAVMAWSDHGWVEAVAAALAAVLTLAGLAFFRDPQRRVPAEPGVMVAPADGRVTEVTPLPGYAGLEGPAWRVGIFLSVLDVHVNRSPCAGVVLTTTYKDGLFLDARHPDSGARNQSHTLVLADSATGRPAAVVRQVVGAIARRIIAPVQPGQRFERGERFGMIAFGSRTELIVPAADWEPAVRVGTHVAGGRDVLLRARQA